MTTKPQLPNQFALLWLFFMQPITLHRRLKAGGIDNPGASAWQLWWAKENRDIKRAYVIEMFALLFWVTPVGGLLLFILTNALGYPLGPRYVAVGVVAGVVFGVAFGVAINIAFGVATGVAISVAGSVAISVAESVAYGVTIGMAIGVVFVVFNVAEGMEYGVVFDVVVVVVTGMVTGAVFGIVLGTAGSVAFMATFILFFFRLPFYPFELLEQMILYFFQIATNRSTLHWTPVLYHDLSYLPHPFLTRHILLNTETHPEIVARVLDACAIAPGQQQAGQAALAHLQANELTQLVQNRQFQKAVDLQGQWLVGIEGADKNLLAFSDIARYLLAAVETKNGYHQLQHLDKAQTALKKLKNQLLDDNSLLARLLMDTLHSWETITKQLRTEIETTAHFIPNPFRAGNQPLSPDYDQAIFRGRDDLVQRIAALLARPEENTSIALLGPRRCGKTSLLKMLPVFVPDAVFIFLDIQDHGLDTPMDFFQSLANEARQQAQRDRRLELPAFPNELPFKAIRQWFASLEDFGQQQNHRILLCIDEFERLEDSFPGDKRDLLKLMGLFRATIQHRRYLRLLVSGATQFDELDTVWSDHFINVQELQIGFLDQVTSLDLLKKPIPEFPGDTISHAVAEAIFERVNGQPYLLQLYAYLLVNDLNDANRTQANLKDVPHIEKKVLSQARNYFENIFTSASKPVRTILEQLAFEQAPVIDLLSRRWLKRRYLLNEQEKIAIPVFNAWIHQQYEADF